MNSIKITAPAKLNLFLKVLNKRKDGYHNIVTLFERISLADEIVISKAPAGIRVLSDKFITKDPKENLAYKAAELILKYRRVNKGVVIRIKKRIPIAGGLGGGSSDAASVLLGLNRLYNLKLKEDELLVLAARLGADVPFFVVKTPFAIGRNIGDSLEKIRIRLSLWHVIAYHPSKISTGLIYRAFDSAGPKRSSKCLTIDLADDKITPDALEDMLYNDLEETASSKLPVTGSMLERLAYSTGRKTILAGSGPSVFCLCMTRKEAMAAKNKFLRATPAGIRRGWQVFIAKTKS